jgi:all-trans-8'-apo-beta-carotenal 15,15'-oxygenase
MPQVSYFLQNVLTWGGRLFALWEAGCPYELDPKTLETLCSASATSSPFTELGRGMDCRTRGITIDDGGPIDEFMKVGKTFTAHPIVREKEERMVAFTSAARANTETILLEFVEYNPSWKRRQTVKYSFSQGLAPHDFCVSDNYYCFFQVCSAIIVIQGNYSEYSFALNSPAEKFRFSHFRSV